MELHKRYAIDECNDKKSLFAKLNTIQKEGKIEWSQVDSWTIEIEDIDLTDTELEKLIHFFNDREVYANLDYDEDDDQVDWDEDYIDEDYE